MLTFLGLFVVIGTTNAAANQPADKFTKNSDKSEKINGSTFCIRLNLTKEVCKCQTQHAKIRSTTLSGTKLPP